MQLRRLAALERQRIVDDLAKIEAEIADLEDILAKPERQRAIVHDELDGDSSTSTATTVAPGSSPPTARSPTRT